MQDLGGCRAIVKDMSAVRKLIARFQEGIEKNPKRSGLKRHELVDTKNYIANPKADGYRSLHYVYAYRSNTKHLECFDGQLIEIQIRTQLQHAWATAIEIVDTFTGQSLKSALRTQVGDESWRRFFALMGTEVAIRERSPLVPGTPASRVEVRRELRALAKKINVEDVLAGLGTAVQIIGEAPRAKAAAYVLELNSKDKSVNVLSFDAKNVEAAKEYLFEAEKRYAFEPFMQVVQVSVEKVEALRTAYPNYFLDTALFLRVLRGALAN
jgi:hypothetical protein